MTRWPIDRWAMLMLDIASMYVYRESGSSLLLGLDTSNGRSLLTK